METYYTDEQTYVGADVAAVRKIEPALNEGVATAGLAISGQAVDGYTIVVTQAKTGSAFTITKAVERQRHPHLHRHGRQGLPEHRQVVSSVN